MLDLFRVDCFDSSGLAMLLGAQRRSETAGITLTLAALPPFLHRVLRITQAVTLLRVVPSVQEALDPRHRAPEDDERRLARQLNPGHRCTRALAGWPGARCTVTARPVGGILRRHPACRGRRALTPVPAAEGCAAVRSGFCAQAAHRRTARRVCAPGMAARCAAGARRSAQSGGRGVWWGCCPDSRVPVCAAA